MALGGFAQGGLGPRRGRRVIAGLLGRLGLCELLVGRGEIGGGLIFCPWCDVGRGSISGGVLAGRGAFEHECVGWQGFFDIRTYLHPRA